VGDSWQLAQVGWECQSVKGALGSMERRVGPMEGEARTAQARVPQPEWDAAQVDAGFEQMRREAMP